MPLIPFMSCITLHCVVSRIKSEHKPKLCVRHSAAHHFLSIDHRECFSSQLEARGDTCRPPHHPCGHPDLHTPIQTQRENISHEDDINKGRRKGCNGEMWGHFCVERSTQWRGAKCWEMYRSNLSVYFWKITFVVCKHFRLDISFTSVSHFILSFRFELFHT